MNINGKVRVNLNDDSYFIATITQNNWGRYSSQYSSVIMAQVVKMNVPRLAVDPSDLTEGVTIGNKFFHVMKLEQKGVNFTITLSDNSEIELKDVVR